MEKGWTRLDVEGVPPGKQGKFDRVYEGPNGEVHVIEAKGVASGEPSFGTRVSESDEVVQQGTLKYRDDIIDILSKRAEPEAKALAQRLEDAQDDELLSYILVRQKTLSSSDDGFVHKEFIE